MTRRPVNLPADAEARDAIATALDDTLIVEAAAGTGKTTEMVTRIVRTVATGRATMDEIVAVTFTEKAAGELKLRLREALEADAERSRSAEERPAADGSDRTRTNREAERGRLEEALKTLEEAHVNTIHGFCAELLRERPVEARVDPLFDVLTDIQAARLYERAFNGWLQTALADPPEGIRRALRRTSGPWVGGFDAGPIDRLRDAGRTLAELRDFAHPWSRRPFDRTGRLDALIEKLHALTALSCAGPESDNLYKSLDGVRRLSRQIQLEQSLGQRDLDGWESRLIDLAHDHGLAKTRKGYGARYGSASRTQVLAARDEFYAGLLQFRADADADLAATLQQELAPTIACYQVLKDRQGALDFVDLLTRTRDVLRSNRAVREHLQRRFTRIFVDEFQDTDPVQAEILLLLTSDDGSVHDYRQVRPQPGKLFIVGDPKQAIYRFRGADVATYWAVRDHLVRCGGRVKQLRTNFRSVPGIQRFVNRAFAAEMVPDAVALQDEYVPLAERRPGSEAQPAIVALSVPAPYTTGRSYGNSVTGRAIEESLPDAVGAFIEWLLNSSGWRVCERLPDGNERPVAIQPQHIAVLFRRFTSFDRDMTRPYLQAIEARGIPHLLVGGKTFHGREEVETIRAALAAIEWPDDELSVFATLKGSLFAIDDEQLLDFRERFGAFHPYRIPRELGGNSGAELALSSSPVAPLLPIGDALRVIQELHRGRNYRPIADTLARLLAATRAHVGFILRPGGEQALANVLHVAELARQYEAGGGISFRGFIDELRRAAEDTDATEAPTVEEGSGGVRLMTVHKAKGLEFPIVILADPTCRLSRDVASRHLDADRRLCAVRLAGWAPHDLHDHEREEVLRDRAEGIRLAYVAATRARDLLVVPAVADEPWDEGWIAALNGALYPAMGSRQDAARAPGCPPIKSRDAVLVRPDDRLPDSRTVAPGRHAFGDYSVVWWDPRWLSLDVKPSSGIRREALIVKEAPRDIVSARRAAYDTWRAGRDQARQAGSAPSIDVRTAGEWARGLEPDAGAVEGVAVISIRPSLADRPAGPSFGLLVHAVLADVPFDASGPVVEAIARAQGRAVGASDEDIAQAAATVERVLRHDLVRRARAAAARGMCRRETPIAMTEAGGALVEGVVDLAFQENGRWIVVDFKTDVDLALRQAEYTRQVRVYADAIAAATGLLADPAILQI
ncbi:MAG TPA: UvrD-helicase domain-containing protein [Vicinamibacterales bacterium]|nr:UvrD-helicase domain-containing protein [Vicinamibacterales bacterium]